jgi:hypothetical protein
MTGGRPSAAARGGAFDPTMCEILSVFSGSPTDVQPVLDAVVESAVRLPNPPAH